MIHELPSKAVFEVQLLSFEDAWAITQSLSTLVGEIDVDIRGMKLEEIQAADVLSFKTPLCKLLASAKAQDAAWRCFERCTYNKLRVTKDTFESVGGRGDFLLAAFYALKDNISPFFGSLVSFLQAAK